MPIVQRDAPRVQPTLEDHAAAWSLPTSEADTIEVEPFISPEDAVFEPSTSDQNWWIAFTAALNGEPAATPRSLTLDPTSSWMRGTRAGTEARERTEAYNLGYALGLSTGISEPMAGYAWHEAEAYRVGFAAGQAVAEAEARIDAQIEQLEIEAMEPPYEPTDADIYPLGCMS